MIQTGEGGAESVKQFDKVGTIDRERTGGSELRPWASAVEAMAARWIFLSREAVRSCVMTNRPGGLHRGGNDGRRQLCYLN